MRSLTIAHLYPDEMNIYGDRGNIITLVKRLQWRGIGAKIIEVGPGKQFNFSSADIVFGGGGQDRGQLLVADDLQSKKANLMRAAKDGVVMLAICGTYQLFGHGFKTKDGDIIPGVGIFQAETEASDVRMIGNLVVDSPFGQLVGFENHSGQTHLDDGQQALGAVVKGFGNNNQDGQEGAVYENCFGTYLHGPVLPKNPQFTDELIKRAYTRRYGVASLKKLDDTLEHQAAKVAKTRPQ